MEIIITDNRKITDIQKHFNFYYPFLKLEFFSKPHKEEEGTESKFMIPTDKTIGEVRTVKNAGNLSIQTQNTVREIEQKFEKEFGLHVQIFKQLGNNWIETTKTDNWTLEHQNEIARQSHLVATYNNGSAE
jgi:hypothetical protein